MTAVAGRVGSVSARWCRWTARRTLQDRLVKEFRLAGVGTIEAGRAFLNAGFLAKLNAKQAVAAKRKTDAHRRLPRGVKLAEVLCFHEERTAGQDWCSRRT